MSVLLEYIKVLAKHSLSVLCFMLDAMLQIMREKTIIDDEKCMHNNIYT